MSIVAILKIRNGAYRKNHVICLHILYDFVCKKKYAYTKYHANIHM